MVARMGTLIFLLLVVAIVLGIVAIVMAVTNRPWTHFLYGAIIAFIIWLVLTLVVH